MIRRHLASLSLLIVASLAGASACEKEPTTPPDAGGDLPTTTDDGGTAVDPGLPPQDPDPAQLATARAQLELGDHSAVVATLEPLLASWTADTQIRARAIANSLLSLARGAELAENGKEYAEAAVTDASRLGDAEVQQFAAAAQGAYLVGIQDPLAAQAVLDGAVAGAGGGRDFARLALAECLLNQAFDEEDKLVDPSKLDAAKAHYETLLTETASRAMKGRAETGLAAVAKYRNDAPGICTHVAAAKGHYEAAAAADFIKEVPDLLGKDCK